MYLRSVVVENVRSVSKLRWSVEPANARGWHVIIGDNGSGKSSLLRSIALALVGPQRAMALRENWSHWLRNGEDAGGVTLDVCPDEEEGADGEGSLRANVRFTRASTGVELEPGEPGGAVWSEEPGWFSASFGPFRRFEGGDREYEKLFESHGRLSAHLTIFGEAVALTQALDWLRELKFQSLEAVQGGALLGPLIELINHDGFLPHGCRLKEVTSKGVTFTDGQGAEVPVTALSDGYRSILSLTFELLRQMGRTFGHDRLAASMHQGRVELPGVVLIDEVDAHLHPKWQRSIGVWFREHFPKLQFIVTTHSPLVCQAAERGSIMQLPSPEGDDEPAMLKGLEFDRLVYGDVLDAYGTGVFGDGLTRSDSSKKKLERLADLNRKQIRDGLSEEESKEQHDLRSMMPSAAPPEDQ